MKEKKIDWIITLVPLAIIVALCILFFALPEQSNAILSQVRFFFGDTFGIYFLIIGLGIFLISIFIAVSSMEILFLESRMKNQSTHSFHGDA